MYRPAMEKMNLEEEKKDYHLAECEWDEKTPDAPWKNKEECERRIHYFKGVKDKEELEKRLSGLLRIYRPEKEFAEDALTRSILQLPAARILQPLFSHNKKAPFYKDAFR